MCPSLEDFVSSWTSTKCGPILCPSLADFVTLRTWDQIWSMMHPSSEDFVTSRTFCSNGSWQRNIQVETNSLFDCLWQLKEGVPFAKSAYNSSIPKKWHKYARANIMTNDVECARTSHPNRTASWHDVNGKHSYKIYLNYLKIFGCVCWFWSILRWQRSLLVVGCSSKSKAQREATPMNGKRSLEKMDSGSSLYDRKD